MNKILDFSPPVEIEIPGPLWLSFPEFSPQEKTNLFAVLEAKHSLLSKAIPGFSIEKDDILTLRSVFSEEEQSAYYLFSEKLYQMIGNRKWVVPKRKKPELAYSEKYLFRIWLNQLGMRGRAFAVTRKLLLENLEGCSAYSSEEKMNSYNSRKKEKHLYERMGQNKRHSNNWKNKRGNCSWDDSWKSQYTGNKDVRKKICQTAKENTTGIPTAVYCRVSTAHSHQQDSLENQILHYQKFIEEHPEYVLTEIYYDQGISGYKEKRPGFLKMLQDAGNGCFRLLITKSISRFARNTETVLKTTRYLTDLGIDVYFELQKIHTLTQNGELLLTLYAAFGQAESENARWLTQNAVHRKYEKGKPSTQLHRCLGYEKDVDGNLIPDKNAALVRMIFRMAGEGWRIGEITRYLNENEIFTQNKRRFTPSAVSRILHNPAYKGDYVCQRYYVNDQRKLVKNKGERKAYYIRQNHEPLVTVELWEKAQKELNRI